jgi:hypothetical protein
MPKHRVTLVGNSMASIWQLRAAARFRRSAKRGRIFGDGKFVLGIPCSGAPRILLYATAEARQVKLERIEQGCCCDCTGDHLITELSEE